MTKPELGSKRQCPKCATRFYDLGNDSPITCISCGAEFQPEIILKPRRTAPEPAAKPAAKPKVEEEAEDEEDELAVLTDDDDLDDSDDDEDIDSLLEVDGDDDDDDVDVALDVPIDGDDKEDDK